MIKSTVEFSVNVKGSLTSTEYIGSFTVKTKLSMRETLRQDEIYRSILGVDSQNAGNDARSIASAISYLTTHIVQAPDFWKALEGGMKCEDVNLITEVNNKAIDLIEAEYKKLSDEAQAAEDILKKV